jgi:acyl carrier protein
MSVSQAAVMGVVSKFIEHKKGLRPTVQPETALLREGLLDSFALIELIAELEKDLGLSLPDGSLIPEDFETPEVLYNRLLEI